jgi:hypothetical protein
MKTLRRSLLTFVFATALIGLSACMGSDNPVSPDTLQRLAGTWVQQNGNGKIQFYADETIKLSLPDDQPPVRLLSTLEAMKDNSLAFGTGDRWNGPVHIEPASDWQSIHLHFPDKKDKNKEIVLDFVREKKN